MKSRHPHFTEPCEETERRAESILEQMALAEKVDLLGGQHAPKEGGDTGGNDRVGIPPLKMADASLGIHWWTDRSTTYPATIALAAAWDRDLAKRMGAAVGRDARARGIHILLGPGVNIYRSPLCGRNFEYLGEDPVLAAESVVAYIEGLQDQGVSATVKHYAGNFQEHDRHGISTDVDERTLREVYLPAFRAAVQRAGTGAVMTAYNLLNDVHCSEHPGLIRDILRGEWGFQGLVMSDWMSTYSAVQAANAGLDLEMPTAKWLDREHLVPAVRDGRLAESVLDDKIRALLRLMICFGWIDNPQQDETIPLEDPQTAEVALEAARRACVLLKNEEGMLPVEPADSRKIAVVGPHAADTPVNGGGSAFNTPWRRISILDGIKAVFGEACVSHCAGLPPEDSAAAYADARFATPDGTPGVLAEYFDNPEWSGEPVLKRTEPRLEQNWGEGEIAESVPRSRFSVRWTGTIRPEKSGTHVFYPCFTGPFRVRVGDEVPFDLLEGGGFRSPRAALNFEAGRDYPVEVLYKGVGDRHGACFGWQCREDDAEREAACRLAADCDLVVFCGGHSATTECEGMDRDFAIPAEQEALLNAVCEANPRTVVVLTAGGNVDMSGWIDKVPALLHAWYPGQEGGTAVAEILAGAVNPSGKLPATFERALEDRSSFDCYHDSDGDKRVALADGVFFGYRHHDRTGVPPRFPFGFGLSYTTFAYDNLQIPATVRRGEPVAVRFEVTNTGKRRGTEVVQLYLSGRAASVPRPVQELKNFAAANLDPGQTKTVELQLHDEDLAFFSLEENRWVVEPGEFEVRIAASAADTRLTGRFELQPSQTAE